MAAAKLHLRAVTTDSIACKICAGNSPLFPVKRLRELLRFLAFANR